MLKKFVIILTLNILYSQLANSQNGYSRDIPSSQLQYPGNSFDGYQYGNGQDQMVGSIPGVPGRDYPTYATPPITSFRCQDQRFPGYYADPEAQCQVFHICQTGNRKDSFLCPNGTLFNQEFLVCDWWNHVDCGRARDFYSVNEGIQRAMEEATQRLLYEAAQRARQQLEDGYNYRNPLLNGIGGYAGGGNRDQGDRYNQNNPNRQYLPSN